PWSASPTGCAAAMPKPARWSAAGPTPPRPSPTTAATTAATASPRPSGSMSTAPLSASTTTSWRGSTGRTAPLSGISPPPPAAGSTAPAPLNPTTGASPPQCPRKAHDRHSRPEPRRGGAPLPRRVHRTGLPQLLHVRDHGPRPAPYWRRPEAGAAAHHLRHERAGPQGQRQVQEIRPHRGGRDRQVPPPRGQRRLRGHGADGPALQLPLPPGGRPGQLGLPG